MMGKGLGVRGEGLSRNGSGAIPALRWPRREPN